MAQVTVWLPDDLYQEVQRRKAAGRPINVSALAAAAVRSAILADGYAALAAAEAEDEALRAERDEWLAPDGAEAPLPDDPLWDSIAAREAAGGRSTAGRPPARRRAAKREA
jgi:hypothetical protein